MPKAKQKSITVPEWVYKLAEDEYLRNKTQYNKLKVKSVARLVSLWIVNNSRSKPSLPHQDESLLDTD